MDHKSLRSNVINFLFVQEYSSLGTSIQVTDHSSPYSWVSHVFNSSKLIYQIFHMDLLHIILLSCHIFGRKLHPSIWSCWKLLTNIPFESPTYTQPDVISKIINEQFKLELPLWWYFTMTSSCKYQHPTCRFTHLPQMFNIKGLCLFSTSIRVFTSFWEFF